MKTPRTEEVCRTATGPMREYKLIEHAQELERENARLREAALDCMPCAVGEAGKFVLVRKSALERLFAALPNDEAMPDGGNAAK